MHKKGPDKGHTCDKYVFLLLTPFGNSEDVDMLIRCKGRVIYILY